MSIQTVVEDSVSYTTQELKLTECDDNKSGNEQHRNHDITTKTLTMSLFQYIFYNNG